ncbi:hypothetical protein JCM31826_10370 [Thermaurantimonas aggregans]|uniref:M23ase beta-sheet core domain-containing protein n=1 Tax=Thermaurantimonas aggregans TaxID=2173829 RepID=A0A401XKJ7_9FLAO|nr:urea transporter [Thermaurantimonas aggregans]MCX8147892.1 urea transporter [Thermaurantimonas aggregans]GCD77555.1 hypothetical protein JCM31826_10370 [Thermaurantimonas aggregans]
MKLIKWFSAAVLNSYAQLFFSNNKWFGLILLSITFLDFYVGILGLFCVLTTLVLAYVLGINQYSISQGFYGFNSLLVGIGLAIYFKPSISLVILISAAGILTLFISLSYEGFLAKYGLPFLSLPFITVFWLLRLSTRQFQSLGFSDRGIYVLNELYSLGGNKLVKIYEWINAFDIPSAIKAYLLSLGAIFFQQNVLAGFLACIGLFLYSRIAFSLSIIGFLIAYFFYTILGIHFNEVYFSYIGFNYILTSIALGGFFIIPNASSYIAQIFIIPIVVVVSISLQEIFNLFNLPVHSLPFNLVVLTVLYGLKFREDNRIGLSTIFWQQNSPEKNLYFFNNYTERFGNESSFPIYLPFYGEWVVTQGHNGEYTHKEDWKYAWDFEIIDEDGRTYKNNGLFVTDYYCYEKNILAPADGIIEDIIDDIEDNPIGIRNLENNWGNTIIIKHTEFLYTQMSHLKKGSITCSKGQSVKRGDILGKVGNSGNSPYPHLHFQIQSAPYVGSKTINYPLSYVYLKNQKKGKLFQVIIPEKGDKISYLTPNLILKKSFHFIVGEQLTFKDESGRDVLWTVKRDYYTLVKYIECEKSNSKAYFRLDDNMLQFTHFEGDKKSMLYYFYLASYKVSFGFTNRLELSDKIPVNMVFKPYSLLIHDFFAPFIPFLHCIYHLSYPDVNTGLISKPIKLKSSIVKTFFGKKVDSIEFELEEDQSGIKYLKVHNKRSKNEKWVVKS